MEAIGTKKPESAALRENMRVILKFFPDDGEKRRRLLNVAEIYTLNVHVEREYYSQLTCAHKKIRVYFAHDVVVTVLLQSII